MTDDTRPRSTVACVRDAADKALPESPDNSGAAPGGMLAHIRRLEAEIASVAAERDAGVAERDAMLQSRSWKITAPVRWLAARLRASRAPVAPQVAAPTGMVAPGGPGPLPRWMCWEQSKTIDALNSPCRILRLPADSVANVSRAVDASAPATGCDDRRTIGFIGSPELRHEISFDARVVCIGSVDGEALLSPEKIRFLLIETSWQPEGTAEDYPLLDSSEGRGHIARIVERCRRTQVPIALWVREVAGNLDRFGWLAGLADVVYVADEEMLDPVRRRFPEARIEWLPPAIQPQLHHPLRDLGLQEYAGALGGMVLFDGWWDLQANLPELDVLRTIEREALLVCESEWDFTNTRLADSGEFRDRVIGCLDGREKTVLDRVIGAEVFARRPLSGHWRALARMMRASAGGSLVAWADGGRTPFGSILATSSGSEGQEDPLARLALLLKDPLAAGQVRHRAWRQLMGAHTYAHRLQRMADDLAVAVRFLPEQPAVACLLVTMRPELLPGCIERFRRDRYPHKELVVVVNDGSADLGVLRRMIREGENIQIHAAARNRSLGACLNFAVSMSDAPYWTKLDDDDFYGPSYLTDVMEYQKMGRFDVFGKPPMFNYLESTDSLMWDPVWSDLQNLVHRAGHSSSALVAGGTIGGRREVVDQVGFSEKRRGGSDSDFIRRCYESGFDVLAMDGFNFVRFRSAKQGFHTWQVSDEEIGSRSRKIGGIAAMDSEAML